jgi:hypothetical protein
MPAAAGSPLGAPDMRRHLARPVVLGNWLGGVPPVTGAEYTLDSITPGTPGKMTASAPGLAALPDVPCRAPVHLGEVLGQSWFALAGKMPVCTARSVIQRGSLPMAAMLASVTLFSALNPVREGWQRRRSP